MGAGAKQADLGKIKMPWRVQGLKPDLVAGGRLMCRAQASKAESIPTGTSHIHRPPSRDRLHYAAVTCLLVAQNCNGGAAV